MSSSSSSSLLKSLVEQEFQKRERDNGSSQSQSQSKGKNRNNRKRAREYQKKAAKVKFAQEGKSHKEEEEDKEQRVRDAVQALLDLDGQRSGVVDEQAADRIANYKRRTAKKPFSGEPKSKRQREADKKAAEGSAFSEEDFQKWSKAYFINSKLDGDDDDGSRKKKRQF